MIDSLILRIKRTNNTVVFYLELHSNASLHNALENSEKNKL